jgi:pyridoxal phosphate enzyme (YggS family)
VTGGTEPDRRAELLASLERLRARIGAACESVGRDPDELSLIAVTKGFPVSDIALLGELGQQDVGESRDQEARRKIAALPEVNALDLNLRWHFVGRLQQNKCRSVASYAATVHSVERSQLVAGLGAGARHAGRRLAVFIQVSLDADTRRGGALVDDVIMLADQVALAPELDLLGVMAIAPMDADPDTAFAGLQDVSWQVRARHPDATSISAGMSGDLEAAIRQGATHLRVGSALLGRRRP